MSFVIIAMALKMMVEARSDFEKKGPSAKIKLYQIGNFLCQNIDIFT